MTHDASIARFTAANRAAWETSAHLHDSGPGWETLLAEAARPGFSVLDPDLTAILRGLAPDEGRTAVQIGCNNARELLSLAALGITPAAGIDQSAAFLAQGARLAAASGHAPRLVEADIYALPHDLGRFDLALVTIGVLNWMPDLPGFFQAAAGLLEEGGHLVIHETHPVLEMFDPDAARPFEPAFSYFAQDPQEVTGAIAYDGKDHGRGETGYWFLHTMGEIVTASVQAGLQIMSLTEYPHSIREPEYDIYEGRAAQVPMSYSLVAVKDGPGAGG